MNTIDIDDKKDIILPSPICYSNSPENEALQPKPVILQTFDLNDQINNSFKTDEIRKKKTNEPTEREVIVYDIALFLDEESSFYIKENKIPSIDINENIRFSSNMFKMSPLAYYDHQKNIQVIQVIKLEKFWHDMIKNSTLTDDDLKNLRFKIYRKYYKRLPLKLIKIFLWIRYKITYDTVSEIKNQSNEIQKNYINCIQTVILNTITILSHISDFVVLAQLYNYTSSRKKINDDSVILLLVRIVAISAPYLISYSSSIELALTKRVLEPDKFKKYSIFKKICLFMLLTFFGPLYLFFLMIFAFIVDFINGIIVFILPTKHFERLTQKLDILFYEIGINWGEYNGILDQRNISQLIFQNISILITDTILFADLLHAPEFIETSLSLLLQSYTLTIINVLKTLSMLHFQAKFFQENFLTFILLCLKAKFGWVPFITKIRYGLIADRIIDFGMIQRPNPIITQLLGLYDNFVFEFSELTIRKLTDELAYLRLNWRPGDPIQEIKIGRSLSNISLTSIGQLLSVISMNTIIIDFTGMDWENCIKNYLKILAKQNNGKIPETWQPITPIGESIISLVIETESKTNFALESLLRQFIKNKADVNAVDSKGQTPLTLAVEKKKMRSLKLLLSESNTEVNSADEFTHQFPLDIAIENAFAESDEEEQMRGLEIINLLLEANADPYQKVFNSHSQRASSIFIKALEILVHAKSKLTNSKFSIVQALINYGCRPESDEDNIILLETIACARASYRQEFYDILESAMPKHIDYTVLKDTLGNNFLHIFFRFISLETHIDEAKAFIERNKDLSLEKMLEETNILGENPIAYSLKYMIDLTLLFGLSPLVVDTFLKQVHSNNQKLIINLALYIVQALRNSDDENLEVLEKTIDNKEIFNKLLQRALSIERTCTKSFKELQIKVRDRYNIYYDLSEIIYVFPNEISNMLDQKEFVQDAPKNQALIKHFSLRNSVLTVNSLSDEHLAVIKYHAIKNELIIKEENFYIKSNLKDSNYLKNFEDITLNVLIELLSLICLIMNFKTFFYFITIKSYSYVSIYFLSFVASYLVSYGPIITLFISKRMSETMQEQDKSYKLLIENRKKRCIDDQSILSSASRINDNILNMDMDMDAEMTKKKYKYKQCIWKIYNNTKIILFGIIILTSICLIYFIALELLYIILVLFPRIIEVLIAIITFGKVNLLTKYDKYIIEFFGSFLNVKYMEVKGFKKLRIMSQLIFETVPQIVIQSYAIFIDFNVDLDDDVLLTSIIFSLIYLIAGLTLLILESKASKSDFSYYAVMCLNARLNWVPFIEKISMIKNNNDEVNVFNYEDMTISCLKNYKIGYEFSNKTIENLANSFINLRCLPSHEEKPIIKFGRTCENINIIQLLTLIKLAYKKIEIEADWQKIIQNSLKSLPSKHPIDLDGEYILISLVLTNSLNILEILLRESKIDPNIHSIKSGKSITSLTINLKCYQILSLLIENDLDIKQLNKGKTLIMSLLEEINDNNFGLLLCLLSSPKVFLSNMTKMKIIEYIKKLVDTDRIGEAIIILDMLGGLNAEINSQKVYEILELYLNEKVIEFLFKKPLPELTTIHFHYQEKDSDNYGDMLKSKNISEKPDIIKTHNFKTDILKNLKRLRHMLPMLYFLLTSRRFNAQNKQIKLKMNPKYFLILYNLITLGKFSKEHIQNEFNLQKLDELANYLCLDGKSFYKYHFATGIYRKSFKLELKFKKNYKYSRIDASDLPSVPLHKGEDIFYELGRFHELKNAVAIKSIKLDFDIKINNVDLFEFELLIQNKSDCFFETLYAQVADKKKASIFLDGKQKTKNIFEIPISDCLIGVYLSCSLFSFLEYLDGFIEVTIYSNFK